MLQVQGVTMAGVNNWCKFHTLIAFHLCTQLGNNIIIIPQGRILWFIAPPPRVLGALGVL